MSGTHFKFSSFAFHGLNFQFLGTLITLELGFSGRALQSQKNCEIIHATQRKFPYMAFVYDRWIR